MRFSQWVAVLILWRTMNLTEISTEAEPKFTPITSGTGIYFDHIGMINFYPVEWKLVVYVDLLPTKNLWKQTKENVNKLRASCMNIKNHTWYSFTDCKQSIPYFESKVSALDRLQSVIVDMIGSSDSYVNSSYRRKRGAFNFIGEGLKFLFGTVTQSDAHKYSQHIRLLEREQKEFLHIATDQMTVLKSTILTMNATLKKVNQNENVLKNTLESLMNTMSSQTQQLKIELESSLIINENIRAIQRGIEECQEMFNLLIEVFLHSQTGVLQPQIITLQRIQKIMMNEKLPEEVMYPSLPSSELLSMIKPIIYTQGSYLVYIVKIPLIHDTPYQLYKSIPFPMVQDSNSTAVLISVNKEYIFVDTLRQKYGKLSDNELSKCMKPNLLNYICVEDVPINTYIDNSDCEASLIHPNIQIIPSVCEYRILPIKNLIWIKLHLSNDWLYVAPETQLFTTVCNSVTRSYRVQGRGILTLPSNCKGLTAHSVLYSSSQHFQNVSKDDIIPSISVDFESYLVDVDQEKIKDLPMPIPLSNIISSTQDLNLASYKIDEVQQLIREQEAKLNNNSFPFSEWTMSITSIIVGIILLIISSVMCCVYCRCFRKCLYWMFVRCNSKNCWERTRERLCITGNSNSVINIQGVASVPMQDMPSTSGTQSPSAPIDVMLPSDESTPLSPNSKLRRSLRLSFKKKNDNFKPFDWSQQ